MKIFLLLMAAKLIHSAVPEAGFEQNRGQAPGEVAFLTRIPGAQVFFTNTEVVISPLDEAAVRLRFPGAAPARWQPDGPSYDHISYQLGSDRSRWVHQAPIFRRLLWRNAYPGIDIAFYRQQGQLEYDLILAPHADAARVRLQWTGSPRHQDSAIEAGAIRQLAPRLYQRDFHGQSHAVTGRFVPAAGGVFRLELGDYDHARPLIVDPVIEAASYVGGESDDEIVATGLGYLVGNTRSILFPGANPGRRRTRDIFVRGNGRISLSDNSASLTGTIVTGGAGDDEATGAALRASGQLQLDVVGTTDSRDWGAGYRGGASDGFVAVFAPRGSFSPTLSLVNISYIGGGGEDRLNAVAGNSFSFVAAGSTNSPDLAGASNAPQSTLAGGRDAFYLLADGTTGYFGGSGDDEALAVGMESFRFLIAGTTTSADLPRATNSYRGGSDGFVASPSPIFLSTLSFTPQSWYVGGSGDDRLTAATCTNGSPAEPAAPLPFFGVGCAFAGITNSPDLPVRDAAQRQLAGGNDAFVTSFNQFTGVFNWLTYWGGSQDEIVRSIVQNWAGDVFIAGATRSPDLPLADEQQKYAGGEDGLIAVFGGDGRIRQSTYYGGAGDDRLNSVSLLANNVARWAGVTTSTDLLEANPIQSRGAGQEGFYVDLGSRYMVGFNAINLPKDAATRLNLRSSGESSQPVTYRSSDPAKLRFLSGGRAAGQVTVSSDLGLSVEALSGEGEVEIAVTSAGYAAKTITVRLSPSIFVVSGISSVVSSWTDRPFQLFAMVRGVDAAGEPTGPTYFPRSGIAGSLRFSSSDQSVLRVSDAQATVLRPGRSTIRWEADAAQSVPLEVEVVTPEPALTSVVAGQYLVTQLPLQFRFQGQPFTGFPRGTFVARSEDPSRLLLMTSNGRARATAVVTLSPTSGQSIQLVALADSGTARVFVTSSEWSGEREVLVELEPTRVRFGLSVPTGSIATLRIGSSEGTLGLFLGTASGRGSNFFLWSDAPMARFRLENSDPRVLETSRLTIDTRLVSTQGIRLRGLAAGSATLSLRALDWLQLAESELRVTVVPAEGVNPQIFGAPLSLTIGRNLQLPVSFRFFTTPQAAAQITVDDPSLAVVSATATAAGAARVDAARDSDTYSFWVQALRGEGSTTVRIRVGEVEHAFPITLLQSTLGFYPREFEGSAASSRIRVGMVALEENLLAPVGQGTPRPGVRIPVSVRVEGGPANVTPTAGVLDVQNSTISVAFSELAGPTTLVLDTPAGYPAAPLAARADLSVQGNTVAGILAQTGAFLTLPTRTVTAIGISIFRPATVRSLHPDRLLLSLSATATPVASIEVPGNTQSVFLHAQENPGVATVRVEAPNTISQDTTVRLAPPTVVVFATTDIANLAPAQAVELQFALGTNFSTPRLPTALAADAQPIRFTLRSSNPAVITVPNEVVIPPGQSNALLRVTAGSPGTAEVTVEAPEGIELFRSSYPFTVRASAPATSAPRVTLGRNLQTTYSLRLPRALSAGGIARVTSSDPAKLVVSRSSITLGTGSISVAIQPNVAAVDAFFLQALSGEGEVVVTVAVEGFGDTSIPVVLRPAFLVVRGGFGDTVIPPSGLAVSVQALFESLAMQFQPVGFTVGILRPGLDPIRVNLRAEPAGVVRNLPASLELRADASPNFTLQAGSPGEAEIFAEAPEWFDPPPPQIEALFVRTPGPAALAIESGCGDLTMVRDSQVECRRNSGVAVTIRSEDPGRVLVSASETQPGQAQITTNGSFSLQALGSFGTTELVLSAPGYPETRIAVVLRPSQIGLIGPTPAATIQMPPSGVLELRLGLFAPNSQNEVRVRAGLQLPVTLEVTPAGVITANPARLTLTSGFNANPFTLRAVSPTTSGAAVLRIRPEGYPESAPYAIRVGN